MKKMLAALLIVALTLSVITTSALAAGGCGYVTQRNAVLTLQSLFGADSGQSCGGVPSEVQSILSQLFSGSGRSWSYNWNDCYGNNGSSDDVECPDGNCNSGSDDVDCPDGNCDSSTPSTPPSSGSDDSSSSTPASSSPPSSSDESSSTPASSSPSSSDSDDSSSSGSSNSSSNPYRDYQLRVIELVNQERTAAGLSPLTESATLDKTATAKSQDMADLNYFSHTSPTYGSPFDLMKQYGISYTSAGENIAMGQTSPESVMNDWMNSEGHRANILNSSYTQIGVGIVKNSNGQIYWTQHFIRP